MTGLFFYAEYRLTHLVTVSFLFIDVCSPTRKRKLNSSCGKLVLTTTMGGEQNADKGHVYKRGTLIKFVCRITSKNNENRYLIFL